MALIAGSNCYPRGQIKSRRSWKLGGGPMKLGFRPFRKGIAFAAVAMFKDEQ